MKAKSSFSLKDMLFNEEKVAYLGGLITAVYPQFPQATFEQTVVSAFPTLELKERIAHIAATLRQLLPEAYPDAVRILLDAQPPPLDPSKTDDDFGDFIFSPLSHFVAEYGCSAAYLELSLNSLREMTKRFSAEGPIRNFINAFPTETMAFFAECATDDNYHVRRLASEGTRPKLPWAQKLTISHTEPLSILDQLYSDSTRYVTRSVANHLNDISKIDSALVVDTLLRWRDEEKQDEQEMAYITQHSLRTLVKQGDPNALGLLGYGETPEIEILEFATSTPNVKIGEAFHFTLKLQAKKSQKLLVDYLMTFASDGKKQGQKVFKLKQLDLEAGKTATIRKKHPMRLMTTRRLYEGTHTISLQINGQPFGTLSFDLIAD